MKITRSAFTKTAFSFSLLLLILWCTFGTGTTIAWYTDTTPADVNSFLVGDLDIEVSHRVETTGTNFEYRPVTSDTELFDNEDLYEPGFTKVVYLKIENKGNIPLEYRVTVNPDYVIKAMSVENTEINLPDYLQFGAEIGSNEQEIRDRIQARGLATGPLTTFSAKESLGVESTNNTHYMALVVYMPEEVGNEANYKGTTPPEVGLGITVIASQKGTVDQLPAGY